MRDYQSFAPAALAQPAATYTQYDGLHGAALSLASRFRGAELRIPDLMKVFAGWPFSTSPHLARLRALFDTTLDGCIGDEKKREALKRADFGWLIALWYPDSEWAELEAVSYLGLWLFVWDDEIDVIETDFSKSAELALLHHRSTLAYVRRALGVSAAGDDNDNSNDNDNDEGSAPENMAVFGRFGELTRGTMSLAQRQRLSNELHSFVAQVAAEHVFHLDCRIPSPEQYREIRRGTAAVMPVVVLAEYMTRTEIPEALSSSPAFRVLESTTVDLIWLINDLYSLPKELADDTVLSIIPVLLHSGSSGSSRWTLDAVVERILADIRASMDEFEGAAKELRALGAGDSGAAAAAAETFILYCRRLTAGVVLWTIQSPRYGILDCTNADGSVTIQL
ncbi:Terpene synthase family protein [Colletotrichum higginsianum IMI 349063]|uniref:Terpene synthase n=1 Tax=Colletotrichum higginsianum (strain IMI 349063) TaxID=759273 RepID=A0A1B7YBT5_COLHI|nr:Terpene synthase family protein [Colletotrichum higginsianum IMI 349063]OBR09487.1 Terpene synthase family protein [Colletotrichum higginsianum IMI 349063]